MRNPKSLSERFFEACVGAFIAAALLYGAVRLIQAVFWWIIAVAGCALAIAAVIRIMLARREHW